MMHNIGGIEGVLESEEAPSQQFNGAADDMIENENESLRDRVADLEKKVLEQTDEIVCLRSTLADVLRRLALLENSRGTINSRSTHSYNNVSNSSTKDTTVRLRHPSHHASSDSRDPRRSSAYIPNYNHRRASHYQSTGSLHSADSLSSNGASSPAPSPSPTHTPLRSSPSPRVSHPPPSSSSSSSPHPPLRSPSSSSLHLSKRWSSTSDFNHIAPHTNGSSSLANRRLATKSLLDLHVRSQQNVPVKHGTKETVYNKEDGCVKMYLRGRPINLYQPNESAENYSLSKVSTAPLAKLQLEWVYGYRGRDCRSNLYFLPTGEMVYFVAAVVVLQDVECRTQRHYFGHTEDIKCIAIHPNKLLVATGQTAGHDRREGRPHIRIWSSVNLHTLHVIGLGDFERSVCSISFSKADGGSLLCAVDDAPDHNISIWDWQKGERGQKMIETKCSSDTVVAAEFHPMDKNTIITCGKSHISFWTLETGGTLSKRLGIFENRDKPKYVTCLAFSCTGDVISGDSSGNILVWERGANTISKMLRNAHDGPVFTLCALKDGAFVSGGGRDGRIVLWENYVKTETGADIPEHLGAVRTIVGGKGNELLVGTTRNSILAGTFDLSFRLLVKGHTDELWGLTPHPNQTQFLTAGYDRMLHLWDTMAYDVVWTKDIGEQAQSACFSPDGSVIIIGTVSGRWLVMDAETREVYSMHNDGTEPIQVARFSPNGSYLALGSRDNNIYVYQVSEDSRKYNRVGRCVGHSSFITHLDWSKDNVSLQSNSGDYELLYWNATVCRQIPQSSQMRDVEWATQTCTLGFPTLGIWPEGADGTDVNTCDRSANQKMMATGDDFGKVKLFAYPVTQPKSLCHTYRGHSSHVTNVCFMNEDSRLISIGGRDTSVMQWVVC